MKKVLNICKYHGICYHVVYQPKDRRNPRVQCSKCRSEAQLKRARLTKVKAVEYKGSRCSVCGYDDLACLGVFDFHHINPEEKDRSIRKLSTYSWKKVNKS